MGFGLVLQLDDEGKPTKIKTRAGKSVKLAELLDEAKKRALDIFEQRMSGDAQNKVQVDKSKLDETAEIMGISSVKYFDLKQDRIQNYVFDFDKMLDTEGNTGVYLLYAYVRVCSIMAKAKNGSGKNLSKMKSAN